MRYILGVDVGTSNVKAVLFDECGKEIAVKSRESHLIRETGNCTEQDMKQVWENVSWCIGELMKEKSEYSENVIGLGVCGQGEGCWLVDEQGEPMQNAILWCDGRAVEEVDAVTTKDPQVGQDYHRITGTPPLLGNQMMLIRWMKNNRKEVLDRAYKLMFCKDWIRYNLTGEIKTEITDAITSLVDVQTGEIAIDLMREMGIEEYRRLLPDPVRSDEVVGHVTDEIAELLHLPKGLPVIAGALDTSATAVGLGAIHEKDACVILGTTCASEIVMNKADCKFGTPQSRYEKHPIGDLYVELQATLNGTPNIDWVLDNISVTRDFSEIDKILERTPVGCGGVVYHPYISVAGERAPFFHPYARASFFGISQVTTRDQMIRAVYEGISMSIRDCLGNVDKNGTLYLAGGGAKSPVWAQMIADVVGMEVKIPSGNELGAKGIALMTGVALGVYENYEDAVEQACTFKLTFEPNEGRAKKYDLLYELYRNIRLKYQDVWDYRHQMNKKIQAIEEE